VHPPAEPSPDPALGESEREAVRMIADGDPALQLQCCNAR
jgi:hypothetical protein